MTTLTQEAASAARLNGGSTTYATARSTCTLNDTTLNVGQLYSSPNYTVMRSFFKFDTSSITTSKIVTKVNLVLTPTVKNAGVDFDVQIVKQDWSAQDPITSSNREAAWDNCLAGTADAAIWKNTSEVTANNTYSSGDLDTNWVNRSGSTYYSIRSGRDRDNNAPTGPEYLTLALLTDATPSKRPQLVVEYTDPNSNRRFQAVFFAM